MAIIDVIFIYWIHLFFLLLIIAFEYLLGAIRGSIVSSQEEPVVEFKRGVRDLIGRAPEGGPANHRLLHEGCHIG